MKVKLTPIGMCAHGEVPAFSIEPETEFEKELLKSYTDLTMNGIRPKLVADWAVEGYGIVVGISPDNTKLKDYQTYMAAVAEGGDCK